MMRTMKRNRTKRSEFVIILLLGILFVELQTGLVEAVSGTGWMQKIIDLLRQLAFAAKAILGFGSCSSTSTASLTDL